MKTSKQVKHLYMSLRYTSSNSCNTSIMKMIALVRDCGATLVY